MFRIRYTPAPAGKAAKAKRVVTTGSLIFILFIFPLTSSFLLQRQVQNLQAEIGLLLQEIMSINKAQTVLADNQKQLDSQVKDFLDTWQIGVFDTTAYSPLDDQNGISAGANPEVMASGVSTTEHLDMAVGADPDLIPYFTPVWIQGIGWRETLDTGGAIKGRTCLDIAMRTYQDAINYGRKEVIVIWPRQRE